MPYAARQDIVELWGPEFLLNLLPTEIIEDEAAIDGAVLAALSRASEEIDGHLSARYTVPFEETPRVLVSPCANIAVYILANRHTSLTKTIEDRYGHAIKFLQRIADGKAGLGAEEPSVTTDPNSSTGGAYFEAGVRNFSRDLP